MSSADLVRLAIVSDIHYAGSAEQQRTNHCLDVIQNRAQRLVIGAYRHYIWQRNSFAHNHRLDAFLNRVDAVNLVVANGDYSCDTAFIGVSDDAARQSALECLHKLRSRYAPHFQATIGDHELGKKPMAADIGGLRLASYERTVRDLALQPFWRLDLGRYVLMGITSTLVALPIYELEALPEERASWRELRREHLSAVRHAFDSLRPNQRVLLFSHDPTALPFLFAEPAVRGKLLHIDRTVIGHLHSNLVFWKSRLLAGMPIIPFLGHTTLRLTSALRQARCWSAFNVLLCPSLAGIELLKDGGFLMAALDPDARRPVAFQCYRTLE